ncbi:Na+-driven multidrug efflux pump [Bacillus sp. V2I10]|nr:Na+-driven multidrug efflux pump [Bacillus sp. V2I10]
MIVDYLDSFAEIPYQKGFFISDKKVEVFIMNHKKYIMLAIPLTLSAMTTALIGAVDTAVAGQLSDPAYIGGVAVGAVLFNTMYWLFGFLRVSTSGFTAQAHGAMNEKLMRL